MKKILFLILFAALVSGATLASSWCGKQVCMMMSKAPMNLYSGLNLSAEQETNLKQLDAKFKEEADPMCVRVCQGKTQLMNLLADKNNNKEAIDQKIEEVGALQTALEKKVADHILDVKKGLNPDQAAAYVARLDEGLQQSMKQCGYSDILKS